MKINLNIDESERQRILEMHESAIKNHFLSEQVTANVPTQREPFTSTEGVVYRLPIISNGESLSKFASVGSIPETGAYLNSLGIKDMPDAVNEPEKNISKRVFELLYCFLDAIAQRITRNELICNGKVLDYYDTLKPIAESNFSKYGFSAGEADTLIVSQVGEQNFKNAIKNASIQQMRKLGGC
jgi:hypothetical protein